VRWLHEKGKEYSGPAGGNGGDGGDVYIRGVRDMNLLSRYRGEKNLKQKAATRREPAAKRARGKDMIIDLPVGSVIRNKETGESTSFWRRASNSDPQRRPRRCRERGI
jgi:GTP-binding protein